MREEVFSKENYRGISRIDRKYCVLKISYSDFSEDNKKLIVEEANKLISQAHSGAANSSIIRDSKTKENDSYAGVLAEFAVLKFLNTVSSGAYRPSVIDVRNQIDIIWKSFSIEVRSSFVNNGILFALYAVDKNTSKPYFDVLGPYYQKYKKDYESLKNIYARVLFEGKKEDVYNRMINKNEKFYIIGFMKGNDLLDLDYHKTLSSANFTKFGELKGDYYVAPIDNIKDIKWVSDNIKLGMYNPF